MSFNELIRAYARHLPHTWDASAEAAEQRDLIRAAWTHFLTRATAHDLFYRMYSAGALGTPFSLRYFLHDVIHDCYFHKPLLTRMLKVELLPQLAQAKYDAIVCETRLRPPVRDAWLCKLLADVNIEPNRFFQEMDAFVSPDVLAALIDKRHRYVVHGSNKNPIAVLRYLYEHKQLDLERLVWFDDDDEVPLLQTFVDHGFADETIAFLRHVMAERRLAVAMATHSRLGAASGLHALVAEIVERINVEADYE